MDKTRLLMGFGWGVVATIAMSVVMILGTATGMAPMPEPIPAAIVTRVFGADLPQPVLMLLAAISHLGYGGVWGALLAAFIRPVTVGKSVALGVFLWLIMQIAVFPVLGWGAFGLAITPAIAGDARVAPDLRGDARLVDRPAAGAVGVHWLRQRCRGD